MHAYINFCKAFNAVCHLKLLLKLASMRICDSVWNWIKSFLSGKFQCTEDSNCCSEYASLFSSVVQSSCLVPLLFLANIDVVQICKQGTLGKLFTDDVELYTAVTSTTSYIELQNCLNQLTE